MAPPEGPLQGDFELTVKNNLGPYGGGGGSVRGGGKWRGAESSNGGKSGDIREGENREIEQSEKNSEKEIVIKQKKKIFVFLFCL